MQPYLGKTWGLEESSAALLISEINMVSVLYRTVQFTLCSCSTQLVVNHVRGVVAFLLPLPCTPHRVVDTFILLRLRFTKSKLLKL